MKKRISLILISCLLLLSGCFNDDKLEKQEEVVKKKGKKEEKALITGEIKTGEKYYRSIVPFEPGGARGLIKYGVDNRLDINEFELGLMKIAQENFSTDKYFYQEGQYLSSTTVNNWLKRSDEATDKDNGTSMTQKGLNPPLGLKKGASHKEVLDAEDKHPKYLSYALEQNYLVQSGKDKVKLGGVVIGLSFNSTYYYKATDSKGLIYNGSKKLQASEVKREAKKMGEEVLRRLRQNSSLKNIPVTVALYQEAEKESVTPGNFFSYATADSDSNELGEWETVDDHYYLFPSNDATKEKRDDAEKFNSFKSKIQDYFPNYVGVVGKAHYSGGDLERLDIEIPMQFQGKAEVISFTQYVTSSAMKQLPSVPVTISIQSAVDKPEALIVRDKSNEEPFVHIYR
ncbi:alkaline D-peptidase extracellular enzyme [Fictibacillus macauensis ZFHKF-1]|uniref:Alkaline D-peptidase extracellular enzyme n=1 Tax=Fictibacillus macauensis ZFHKF-1 TaxID=1196324 RepID=I8IXC3_9BACL|nr:CamS family sex pheromone protein [Fictibacillus macauensis]EIT84131.1 alkaline D-peptidase extracellular enzyme [Fictibacillus macauensis ZFHKF-1]